MTWVWIEKALSPPGVRQVRRATLYRVIGRIGDQIADDMRTTKREFFAALATCLDDHGKAAGLYRLPAEGEESHRARLIRSRFTLETTGKRSGLEAFLAAYVPGRFKIIDTHGDVFRVGVGKIGVDCVGEWPAVVVHVEGLMDQEKEDVCRFLEWGLGADIEFRVLRREVS